MNNKSHVCECKRYTLVVYKLKRKLYDLRTFQIFINHNSYHWRQCFFYLKEFLSIFFSKNSNV